MIAVISTRGPFPILILIIVVPLLQRGKPEAVRKIVGDGERIVSTGMADKGKTDLAAPESTTTAKLYVEEINSQEITTFGSSAFTANVVTAKTGDLDDEEAERDFDD